MGERDFGRGDDPFQSCSDIDAVAHQIAVGLLDHIAQMNADAELDAALRGQAGIAFDHAVLHFDRAAHGVDHAAELDDEPVTGALDDATVMHGDGGVDQIGAKRPEPRQSAIFVRPGKSTIANDVGGQDRRDFSGLVHGVPPCAPHFSTKTCRGSS